MIHRKPRSDRFVSIALYFLFLSPWGLCCIALLSTNFNDTEEKCRDRGCGFHGYFYQQQESQEVIVATPATRTHGRRKKSSLLLFIYISRSQEASCSTFFIPRNFPATNVTSPQSSSIGLFPVLSLRCTMMVKLSRLLVVKKIDILDSSALLVLLLLTCQWIF